MAIKLPIKLPVRLKMDLKHTEVCGCDRLPIKAQDKHVILLPIPHEHHRSVCTCIKRQFGNLFMHDDETGLEASRASCSLTHVQSDWQHLAPDSRAFACNSHSKMQINLCLSCCKQISREQLTFQSQNSKGPLEVQCGGPLLSLQHMCPIW